MKKTIITVFLVLAVLVAVFLIWELFFAKTGILHTVYNGAAAGINNQFHKASGTTDYNIVPLWDGGDGTNDEHENLSKQKDGGFNIDIQDN